VFVVLTSRFRVIARVHLVHVMNAEQRQTAADLWIKPSQWLKSVGFIQAAIGNHSHRHLLLLSPKADTHFTIPQRVEG